jgi:3-oxocholest-4-en-26-oyl-CoA dehydrogenase beta subunit
MDFSLSEDQQSIVELARRILGDLCRPETLREVEAGPDWFHRPAWDALAAADLLGLCLPGSIGGGGYGFLEACLLLREVGRAVAPVPLWSTVVGGLVIADAGTTGQQGRWLGPVVGNAAVLAVALDQVGGTPRHAGPVARWDGDGWTLSGTRTGVAAFHLAASVIVPARDADGTTRVFVVPTDAPGLTAARQDTFNHEPSFHLDLNDVPVGADDELSGGQQLLDRAVDVATVGLCAVAAGVADEGMRRTAAYVTERRQFGRPVGSFQAVGHRMADCFVDNEAIRLTMLSAATRVDRGEPADSEVAVAKYWASYGGRRIGHADLHLHGGISIDLDYPIHRYFLWAKHLEHRLGGASEQLAVLGRRLAAS